MKYYLRSLKGYWPTAKALSVGRMSRFFLFSTLLSIPVRKRLFGKTPKKLILHIKSLGEVKFFVRDGADISALREIFAEGEYRFMETIKYQPKHIADIGAHIGSASLFFMSNFPEAKIVCYEPDPGNFQLCKLNLKRFPSVTLINAAVAGVSGKVAFYAHRGSSTKSSITKVQKEESFKPIEVDAVMLNSVIQRGVDMIKFDVEGSEYEIFSNVSSDQLRQVRLCFGEFHHGLVDKTKEEFQALFPGFTVAWKNNEMNCSIVSAYQNN